MMSAKPTFRRAGERKKNRALLKTRQTKDITIVMQTRLGFRNACGPSTAPPEKTFNESDPREFKANKRAPAFQESMLIGIDGLELGVTSRFE